jgi:hypothetical protein
MIKATMVLTIALYLALALACFVAKSVLGGVIMLLFAGLHAFLFYLWRSRIPLAALILETVVGIYRKYVILVVF